MFKFQFRNAFLGPVRLNWRWQTDTPPEQFRLADFKPARGWVGLEVELESPIPLRRGQRFRLFSNQKASYWQPER